MLKRRVAHSLFAITLFCAIGSGALAEEGTPPLSLTAIEWGEVLAHDPGLKRDSGSSLPGLRLYDVRDGDGAGEVPTSGPHGTVYGKIGGGAWVAAVPLPSGGSSGNSGWLIYEPSNARHIGFLPGQQLGFVASNIIIASGHYVGTEPTCCPKETTLDIYQFRQRRFEKIHTLTIPSAQA